MKLAAQKKIHIVTGIAADQIQPPGDSKEHSRNYYNAIALIEPTGKPQFYFKRDLVPFGETVPWFNQEWLATQLQKVGVDFDPPYQPGPANPPPFTMTTANGQHAALGPLSCFELIKPELAHRYREQTHTPLILVNTSNLGWFHGDAWIAHRRLERLMQKQFLAIGQMRAVENRSFVIIAANTGISAIIDPMGNVLSRSDWPQDTQALPGGATLLELPAPSP